MGVNVRNPFLIVSLLALLVLPAAAQEGGTAPRAWMGVYLDNAPPPPGEIDPAEPWPAVVIRRVVREGPAAEAGLRARDEVLTLDGQPLASSQELISRLSRFGPGTWVDLGVRRGERELTLRVRLGSRPERVAGLPLLEGWIGVEAIDLPPDLRRHFGAPEEAGVMISALEPASPAESAGLDLGDVVFEIDGQPVRSARELRTLIAGGGIENTLELVLMRNGAEIVVETLVEPAPEEEGRRRRR